MIGIGTANVVQLTKVEAKEIECFRERRESYGWNISVANIHNVPNFYPEMYKRMFKTESTSNNLFCLGGPRYCDQDEEVVNLYEKALREGYAVLK